MRPRAWVPLIIVLLSVSAGIYTLHFVLFRDIRVELDWLMMSAAFLPINIILVTLFIDRLLSERARQSKLHKLNMVIGAFFSEVGRELMSRLAGFDRTLEDVREHLMPSADWTRDDFARHRMAVLAHPAEVDALLGDLPMLRDFLAEKRGFVLSLLANPNLLEHESFSELLWAVTHLGEELAVRDELREVRDADKTHVETDIRRAYTIVLGAWLDYMAHLARDYPYLFSLAVRLNPFDPDARVTVTS